MFFHSAGGVIGSADLNDAVLLMTLWPRSTEDSERR
jgi:hypothetical protein